MPRPISITMFCTYVESSMLFAKIQTIPSVTGIETRGEDAAAAGTTSVPKTKIEQEERDRDRDEELADLEVAREDGVEVVLDRRLAGDVDLRARDRPDRAAHRAGVALRVRRVERRDDRRRRDVRRHGAAR